MQPVSTRLRTLRERHRHSAIAVLLLLGSLSLAFLWQGYSATPVNLLYLHDDAHVLDQNRVVAAALGVGYNIDLYTFDGHAGSTPPLLVGRASVYQVGTVVMLIDTRHRSLDIRDNGRVSNNPVSFTRGQYQSAQRAFQAALPAHGFTVATVAALRQLARDAASNRLLPSLPWLVGMLLDFCLCGSLLVYLLLPQTAGRGSAPCESARNAALLP